MQTVNESMLDLFSIEVETQTKKSPVPMKHYRRPMTLFRLMNN